MKVENLIHPNLQLKIEKNKLAVKEDKNKGDNSKLQGLFITDLPDNYIFAFSLDKKIAQYGSKEEISPRNQFLNPCEREDIDELKAINSVCDAIIIFYNPANEQEIDIALIELKTDLPDRYSSKATRLKPERQLINSKLFIDYLLTLYNTHELGFEIGKPLIIKKSYFCLFYLDKARRILGEDRRDVLLGEKKPLSAMRSKPNLKVLKIPVSSHIGNRYKWNDLKNEYISY